MGALRNFIDYVARQQISGLGSIYAPITALTYESEITTNVIGSSTLGSFTDTGCSITLPAGKYLVSFAVAMAIDGASPGTGVQFVFSKVVFTKADNTIITGAIDGNAGGTSPASDCALCSKTFLLTVATETTFKTRFAAFPNSGTPTITGITAYGDASFPLSLSAVKIGTA